MFNNLANYLLGTSSNNNTTQAAGRVEETTNIRLTAVLSEDDWVLIDRDSEGNSDVSSVSSSDECCDDDDALPFPTLLTRTSSTSSLPCTTMEESWFITPPPCFTSAGPIHMETSPLENLLIEHPSMSVYQHSQQPVVNRRHNSVPIHLPSSITPENFERLEDTLQQEDEQPDVRQEIHLNVRQDVIYQIPRRNRTHILQQQEMQRLKNKKAQQVQIRKTHQYMKRNYLERNNKAREVNSRNRRLRRGERSQGATRSFANNNRKC